MKRFVSEHRAVVLFHLLPMSPLFNICFMFLFLLFFDIFFSYARASVRTDSYAADLASISGCRLSAATR